jgi:predicted Rdx family selenoprotein
MSKNKNNRLLIIVFAVLLVAVGANELIKSSKGERTFRKDIIATKANDIKKISIFPKNAGNRNVDVFQEDSLWKLKVDGKQFAADQEMIKGIIDELANMTPDRLVATNKDLWKDYDITDSLGVKVIVYGQDKEKTELTLGRFSYNQSTRKPSTYVRVDNEKEVYAVEGYLGMTFNREINSLRDKKIFRCNQNDLTGISFSYPMDSSFTLAKQDNKWLMNGMPVDSTRMAGYLNTVSDLTGTDFRDDFIPAGVTTEPLKIVLTGNNMKPVEIKAFRDATGSVINSSENSTTYFSGDKADIYKRVFQGKNYFFAAK